MALLRHRGSQREVLAACTHLFWNPAYPDVKALQVRAGQGVQAGGRRVGRRWGGGVRAGLRAGAGGEWGFAAMCQVIIIMPGFVLKASEPLPRLPIMPLPTPLPAGCCAVLRIDPVWPPALHAAPGRHAHAHRRGLQQPVAKI